MKYHNLTYLGAIHLARQLNPPKSNISHSHTRTVNFTTSEGKTKCHSHRKFCVLTKWTISERTSSNFASNTKPIRANQPIPIPPEIIRKPFQGEQKSINPHSKPIQCQKPNSVTIPKIMKMYSILNNAVRNLYNTEAATGFP